MRSLGAIYIYRLLCDIKASSEVFKMHERVRLYLSPQKALAHHLARQSKMVQHNARVIVGYMYGSAIGLYRISLLYLLSSNFGVAPMRIEVL